MHSSPTISNYIPQFFLIALLICLVPWAYTQTQITLNADILYLSISAERFLYGSPIGHGYYDTNPPLSMLVYIPAVLLSKVTALPLYHALTVYFFTLLSLSVVATHFLLKKIPDLSVERRYIILGAYLVGNSVFAHYNFGQRDHMLIMAVFPLSLLQILMTVRAPVSTILKWPVLLAGSILILLKPHYALIPAFLFGARILYQKRFDVFKDSDFLILAGFALIYIALILTLFPEFIAFTWPDLLTYYVGDKNSYVLLQGLTFIVLALIPCILWTLFLKQNTHWILPTLSLLSALSLIPYIMMGKGFNYQLLPAMIFGLSCWSLCCYELCLRWSLHSSKHTKRAYLCFPLILLVFIIYDYTHFSFSPRLPTHQSYKNSALAKVLNQCDEPSCSFFMFNDLINMPHELVIYTGQDHASRFPYLWMLIFLKQDELNNEKLQSPELTKRITSTRRKYLPVYMEDLQKFSPDTLLIGQVPFRNVTTGPFDFIGYMQKHADGFNDFMQNYRYVESIKVDRANYLPATYPDEGLITYDVYTKQPAHNGE